MILVIDNYDSFTWNLVHYLMELGAEVEVVRNDAISAGQAISSGATPKRLALQNLRVPTSCLLAANSRLLSSTPSPGRPVDFNRQAAQAASRCPVPTSLGSPPTGFAGSPSTSQRALV